MIVSDTSARLGDEWYTDLPPDLYIPPHAFAVWLEQFEGPLDFLLYLVRKNNVDLRMLPIAPITAQYLEYIQVMQILNIELAADYLLMASLLTVIKSKLLLPKPIKTPIEEDPRQTLQQQLEQYAMIKQAARTLNHLPLLERDVFKAMALLSPQAVMPAAPLQDRSFDVHDLTRHLQALLQRSTVREHQISADVLQLSERLADIRALFQKGYPLLFQDIINPTQGRLGVIVSFMAVLELLKQGELCIISAPLQPLQLMMNPV